MPPRSSERGYDVPMIDDDDLTLTFRFVEIEGDRLPDGWTCFGCHDGEVSFEIDAASGIGIALCVRSDDNPPVYVRANLADQKRVVALRNLLNIAIENSK